jgi:hypothetical protein
VGRHVEAIPSLNRGDPATQYKMPLSPSVAGLVREARERQPRFGFFAAAAVALAGAGDGVEELVIAGKAAAILRWAAPLAAAEVGVERAGFGRLDPLDDDAVLPVVAPVIGNDWSGEGFRT